MSRRCRRKTLRFNMAAVKPLPSKETLREYFSYDSRGLFIRLKRSGQTGKVGAEARGHKHSGGYRYLGFQGIQFRLHRLVWQFHYGNCPNELDHINRNKDDNRLENLRAATLSQNHFNVGLRRDNSSGTKGLRFEQAKKLWHGRVWINGKRVSTGRSKSKAIARQKLLAFQRLHHGEFYAKN